VLERHLAYWTRQLADLPELRFPTDRPRPPAQSFRGAHMQFTLPQSLTAALRELSRKQGGTLYTVTLAGFKALLHYYCGQEDIVVGTNVANRDRIETEGLIGYFANALVLRTSLADDPTFTELLARVSKVSLGAFVHQELPFDKVVEALKPERDVSRNPLFQILFGLNNSPAPDVTLPELSLTGLEVEKGTNLFDLSLFLTDGGPSVACVLRYSTDLFEAASIARLRALYEVLLTHAAAHPHARLSELRGVLERADGELRRAAVEDQKKLRKQIFRSVRRRPLTEEAESL
jgi:non-ribosomal peptide synthetase component F